MRRIFMDADRGGRRGWGADVEVGRGGGKGPGRGGDGGGRRGPLMFGNVAVHECVEAVGRVVNDSDEEKR